MLMGDLITKVVKALGKEEFEEACRSADESIGAKNLKGRGHDPRERILISSTHLAMIKKVVRHEKIFIGSSAHSYKIFFAQGMGNAIYRELSQKLLESTRAGMLSNSEKRSLLESMIGV